MLKQRLVDIATNYSKRDIALNNKPDPFMLMGKDVAVVVQFFDWQCSRCGDAEIDSDLGVPNLKLVHKDGNHHSTNISNMETACPACVVDSDVGPLLSSNLWLMHDSEGKLGDHPQAEFLDSLWEK